MTNGAQLLADGSLNASAGSLELLAAGNLALSNGASASTNTTDTDGNGPFALMVSGSRLPKEVPFTIR